MLFITTSFIQFLVLLVTVYWVLVWVAPKSFRKFWLLLGAIFFWWNSIGEPLRHMIYIGVSLVGNYALYLLFTKNRDKRGLWIVSAFNLSILFYYSFLFFQIVSAIWTEGSKLSGYFSPLGISFYSLAFLQFHFDLYKTKKTKPVVSVADFLLFGSFFAVSNAGPILRWRRFQEEIPASVSFFLESIPKGLAWICLGIVKRVLLSDTLQEYCTPIYESPSSFTLGVLVSNMYINTFQMYLDFSGYVDIGRGSAKLLGYDLPLNFRAPFLAVSIREYLFSWNRTLGVFLRETAYKYLKKTKLYAWVSIGIVCILYSFWYRTPSESSVLFGGVLFVFLIAEHWIRIRTRWSFLNRSMRILITFHAMGLLWFLLRFEKLELFLNYIRMIFRSGEKTTDFGWTLSLILGIVILIQFAEKKFRRFFF